MRKILIALTAFSTLAIMGPLPARAFDHGCYRMGETGYHWYGFCAGFDFLYPHHRVCGHGRCWYN